MIFRNSRSELNEEIFGCGRLSVKRFFALDHQAHKPGPLGTKTKELLGLVASAVLRCERLHIISFRVYLEVQYLRIILTTWLDLFRGY